MTVKSANEGAASSVRERVQNRRTPLPARISDAAVLLFHIVFSVVFAVICFSVVFCNDRYQSTALSTFALVALALQAFVLCYRFLGRQQQWLERHFAALLYGTLFCLFVGNLCLGVLLRYQPVFDLGAIYDGAQYWVQTGTFMAQDNWAFQQDYYYYFPNNLGGMTCLYIAFSIGSFLGASDYYMMACVFATVCAVTTVWLTVLIARRWYGVRGAVIALVMFVVSAPFWCMGATFYTDTLSMAFPVVMLYAYVRYAASKTRGKALAWLVLLGVAGGVGAFVKATVWVMLVAIVLYHLCKGMHRADYRALPHVLAAVLVMFAVSTGASSAVKITHMQTEKLEQLATPTAHWVMMSLRYDNGGYNPDDYVFTRSFDDTALRDEMIQQEIFTRIEERGVSGMLRLFYTKSIVVFGDGTYGQSDFLDDNPVSRGTLHEYVLYDGAQRSEYTAWCSGVFFAILCLMLCAVIGFAFVPAMRAQCYIPQLSVFGIWLFLMFWECSARYITNYVSMMILCAACGVEFVVHLLSRPKNKITTGKGTKGKT